MNFPIHIAILLLLASGFLAWAGRTGWVRFRDPLHPALWLSVLFFLGMVAEPWQCLNHPDIVQFFPDYEGLLLAMAIQYVGMVCLFWGMLSVRGPRFVGSAGQSVIDVHLTAAQKRKLLQLAWVLGLLAIAAYWFSIYQGGGFFQVYSRAKGGGRAISGYQGEAYNLGVAAMLLYAIGVQGKRLSPERIVPMLMFSSPLLLPGIFGGFRGPLFLGMAGLFFAFHVAKGRLPKPRVIVLAAAAGLLAILFVQSQRHQVYFGSGESYDMSRLWQTVQQEHLGAGDNFVVSSGAVITHHQLDQFHYGRRFLITFFIRPIPRQLWPSQYNDMARFLYGEGRTYRQVQYSFGEQAWTEVLGWTPLSGYAVNTITDLYTEFSWGFVAACWGLGWLLGRLWANFRQRGGLWLVFYAAAMALSVYLPTQSFSAFAHRFLYISVMTFLIARLVVGYQLFQKKRKTRRRLPYYPDDQNTPPQPPHRRTGTPARQTHP